VKALAVTICEGVPAAPFMKRSYFWWYSWGVMIFDRFIGDLSVWWTVRTLLRRVKPLMPLTQIRWRWLTPLIVSRELELSKRFRIERFKSPRLDKLWSVFIHVYLGPKLLTGWLNAILVLGAILAWDLRKLIFGSFLVEVSGVVMRALRMELEM
jgi:hypothetical protein